MNAPIVRFVTRAALATASAVAVTAAAGGLAVAEPVPNSWGYVPPEITFTAGPDSITAQIHNPNTKGICHLTIGIDQTVHYFGGESAILPGPGETVSLTTSGLAPGEYRGNTWCADDLTSSRRSDAGSWTATVGPQPEPPKSFWDTLFTGSAG